MIDLLLIFGGLVGLVIGGEWLVRGASRLALATGLSQAAVGLTVVAAGTSMPELAVSVSAALAGSPDLAVGNVVGSNIYNVFLIVGLAALVAPCRVEGHTVVREWPIMVGATLGLMLASMDGSIGRAEGAVGLVAMVGFTAWILTASRQMAPEVEAQVHDTVPRPADGLGRALVSVTAGCITLAVSADVLVRGAVLVASAVGVSDRVVGLTVIAVGTSLPELFTSVVASFRGNDDVAIGNVIGSNIFNILFILGATAVITPVPVTAVTLHFDMLWMIAAALALGAALWPHRVVSRARAVLLLFAAVGYTTSLLV